MFLTANNTYTLTAQMCTFCADFSPGPNSHAQTPAGHLHQVPHHQPPEGPALSPPSLSLGRPGPPLTKRMCGLKLAAPEQPHKLSDWTRTLERPFGEALRLRGGTSPSQTVLQPSSASSCPHKCTTHVTKASGVSQQTVAVGDTTRTSQRTLGFASQST